MNGDVKTKVGFWDSVSWDCPCRRMSSENQGVRSMDMTWYPKNGGIFQGRDMRQPVRKKFTRPATSLCRCCRPMRLSSILVEQAVKYGKKEISSSIFPQRHAHIIRIIPESKRSRMYLLDSPVSGGNPKAKDGTLAIMTGGDKDIFEKVKPLLACMGEPVYTGGPGSGDVTKLVNNTIGGAYLAAIAEGYAFAAKAGIDLQTTFEATRCGFAGGPLYDNKVPKIIARDYEPGARIAVHRKDILNAKSYAHKLGIDLPVTDVTLLIMDWMNDNGYIDIDQAGMVKYFEDKMDVTVGKK